jgi:hypothetical protein
MLARARTLVVVRGGGQGKRRRGGVGTEGKRRRGLREGCARVLERLLLLLLLALLALLVLRGYMRRARWCTIDAGGRRTQGMECKVR